ncbi:hypothetical protein ACFL2K_01145 [Candidatus Margulisiibacteriota bacterium]
MNKELIFFNDKNQITPELSGIVFDPSINNRYSSIQKYLTEQKIKYKKDALEQLTKTAENEIFKQVRFLAYLIYYIMETSGDWGEAGEQQIKISFCRNLLQKDPRIQLSQEDAFNFLSKVEETIKKLKIDAFPLDMAKNKYKNHQFSLLGQRFSSYKTSDINRILRFCGSKRFLQGGFYGDDKEFIFGEGDFEHQFGYDVIYLDKELARTPNNIVAMAAIIGNREIYIRKESLKIIFAQKWLEIFNYDEAEIEDIKSDIYRNISEGIKWKTLSLFNVSNKKSLEKIENQFIEEMGETILYHEFGHGLTQHDLLPTENAAIGEATKIFGENIYTSMLEFMADFAPNYQKIIGPIQNMIRISKKDKAKASRMYYMYLSDTWFFDTDDEYMFIYSDLMALLLLKYIEPNQEIDFSKLEENILYNPNKSPDDKPSMFERILDLFVLDTNEIKAIAEDANFKLLDKKLKYNEIRQLMINQFKQNDGFVEADSYEFLVPYWTNMLGYISSISDSEGKLKKYLEKQEKTILKKMLILSAGKKEAEKFEYNHRHFLTNRLKSLGIIQYK